MGTLQYQNQNALLSTDRDFTATLPQDNELLPDVRSYSAVLSARQAATEKLDFYGDALFTRRDVTRFNRFDLSIFGDLTADTDTTAKGFSGSLGLRYALTPRWSVDLGGTVSQQKAHQRPPTASRSMPAWPATRPSGISWNGWPDTSRARRSPKAA